MLHEHRTDRGETDGDAAHRASDYRPGDLARRLRPFRGGPEQGRGQGTTRAPAGDDDKYIYVELDFDTAQQAEAFKRFLETRVWSSPHASPGLGGTPRARVLTEVS